MRLIVTRPEPEAGRWVAQCIARGVDAVALPLIEIAPAPDPQPLLRAWEQVGRCDAVMFVSAAAVRHFFGAVPAQRRPAWVSTAWATGPGTAQALRAAGVPAHCIAQPAADAGQFDSEALWQVVGSGVRAGQQVLIVRGAGADGEPAGRDWLANRLAAAGVRVEAVAAYRRRCPQWTAPQRALAQAAIAGDCAWLFSSSEAIAHLGALLPAAPWAQARAIATHERIASAAREAGFGVVCLSRPSVEAAVAALESFQ